MSKPYDFESPIVTETTLGYVANVIDTNYLKKTDGVTQESFNEFKGDVDLSDLKTQIEGKVDKVEGSGLITDAEKAQIETNKTDIAELKESGGGSASLTIRIQCDDKYNTHTFTATDKSAHEYTAVAAEGTADIVIPDGGTYTVKNDLDATTVEVEVENPLITFAEFFEYSAKIKVTIPSALLGSTIICKLEDKAYKVVALSTSITFTVHQTGTWTIGVEGNDYIKTTVEVQDGTTSYSAKLEVEAQEGIPSIVVSTDANTDGHEIKCTKDDVTLSQVSANKTCTFFVPSLGEWTLTSDDFPEKEVKVNVAEAKEYKAAFKLSSVYTLKIDKNNTDPNARIEYQDDAEGMTPMSVEGTTVNYGDWKDTFFFEKIYPVMLRADGTVEYKLNPDDYSKKLDGGDSQVSSNAQSSNAMVCIEKMYTKFWSDDYYEYMSISDGEKDGYTAFGFQREDGSEMDCTYLAMFMGSYDAQSHLRSVSGQSIKFPDNTSSSSFPIRTNAIAQGENYGLGTWAQYQLLDLMFNIFFKTEDCTKMGTGRKGGGEKSGVGTGSGSLGSIPTLKTGILNTSGPIGVDETSGCVKFMHVEDYFSDRTTPLAEMIDGLIMTFKSQDKGTIHVKAKRPYSTVGADGGAQTTDYTNEATFIAQTGNIKTSVLNNNYGRVPAVGGATSSTFECDQVFYDSSQYMTTSPKAGVRRGGIRGLGSSWFHCPNSGGNYAYFRASCCARLSFEPPAAE